MNKDIKIRKSKNKTKKFYYISGGNMEIVVVDGQGGGIGKNIIQVLKEKHPEYVIIGVGDK